MSEFYKNHLFKSGFLTFNTRMHHCVRCSFSSLSQQYCLCLKSYINMSQKSPSSSRSLSNLLPRFPKSVFLILYNAIFSQLQLSKTSVCLHKPTHIICITLVDVNLHEFAFSSADFLTIWFKFVQHLEVKLPVDTLLLRSQITAECRL